ncbi:MAG: hypothetical protein J2P59_11845, partial [Acidimicrobiales bacterium]|nr:hypothetical protein [Acidimicrobiales bacterium]
VLGRTCEVGFAIGEVLTHAVSQNGDGADGAQALKGPLATTSTTRPPVVEVSLHLSGKGSIAELATSLSGLDGVVSVNAGTGDEDASDI